MRSTRALVIGMVAFALAVGGFVLWQTGRDRGPTPTSAAAEAAALGAARAGTLAFFTLDAAHVEDDVDRALALGTGKFRAQYEAARAEVAERVRENDLRVTAEVPADGIALESWTPTKAVALVGVDVSTASGAAKPVRERYRTRVTVVRSTGTWLVAGLTQVDAVAAKSRYRVTGLGADDAAPVRAAVATVVPALSYDHHDLEAGIEPAVVVQMTQEFAERYRSTFRDDVMPVAVHDGLTVKTAVRGAALVDRTPSTARVLVFADQVSTEKPVTATPARLLVDLERIGDRWRVADLRRL